MISKAIIRAYKQLEERNYDKIYWCIDLHDTCFVANYNNSNYRFINKDVYKALEYINKLEESVIILWSSCHNYVKEGIIDFFEFGWGINIDHFNENPEVNNSETGCFDEKFYFSILIDDKAGFDADTDWKIVLKTLQKCQKLKNGLK